MIFNPIFIAAEKCSSKYCCFLNSFSIILDKDWLLKLYQHISQPGVGLVGATGSWGRIGKTPIRLNKEGISYLRQLARYLYKYLKKMIINRLFLDFPNYHIRTNGFMIERDVMLKIHRWAPLTKMNSYILESGRYSFTNQVESMGLRPMVVGRNGKGYEKNEWDSSNTFWRRAQENLLISDNQTRKYDKEDADKKKKHEFFAWGSNAKEFLGQ